jgi:hypothetical protein
MLALGSGEDAHPRLMLPKVFDFYDKFRRNRR